jgi:3-phenylpropionate/trans-cinnamate dioxygenase ferredoxin reductase component
MTGIVIIGGGMAGARTIINLRANNYDGPITMVTEEDHLPYDRPPLSKASILEDATPEPILLIDESIVASLKATVLRGTAVTAINRSEKSITLATGESLLYTKLVLATGAKPRRLTCEGGEHAITLRDYKDTLELRRQFQPGKNIVVIGGGFIGLELASSAIKKGCNVTLVEAQPRILMRGVPEAIAKIVHDRHVAAGVNMLVGTGLKSISATSVILNDDREIPADTVIAGIGASPETKLAADAGIAIENGIACNEHLQTSDPDIFAAGDCCSFLHQTYGKRIRLEAWRSAQDQATTVAENILGGNKVHTSLPWFWSDQYDLSLQIAGMPDMGVTTVARQPSPDSLVLFHLTAEGKLIGVSAIGVGNAIGRDVKLTEMLIAKDIHPSAEQLSDPAVQLKSLLKG